VHGQVTAYRDFTSCAVYASYVRSLGGTAKEAANCANNLRRVLLVSELDVLLRLAACCLNMHPHPAA
jgi:hypothetical protein